MGKKEGEHALSVSHVPLTTAVLDSLALEDTLPTTQHLCAYVMRLVPAALPQAPVDLASIPGHQTFT